MPITPKPGHWYKRRDGEIVQYEGPNNSSGRTTFPHRVGSNTYTDTGRLFVRGDPHTCDLVKDHGTTDPRKPKKPRKAPAKKTRKVRMWFMQVGNEGKICNNLSRDGLRTVRRILLADTDSHYVFGPIFSHVIDVPVTKKAPHA